MLVLNLKNKIFNYWVQLNSKIKVITSFKTIFENYEREIIASFKINNN